MPTHFALFGVLVPTPLVALVAFIVVAKLLVRWHAKRRHVPAARLERSIENAALFGLAAARLAFVLENWAAYRARPWTALYFWLPGYVLWAGLASGALYVLFVSWRRSRTWRTDWRVLVFGGTPVMVLYVAAMLTLGWWVPPGQLGPGSAVPPVSFVDRSGQAVQLSLLRGSPVVLNIWASWCPACRREMPLLNRTYSRWKGYGLKIVGVDLAESTGTVNRFLHQVSMSYPVWMDPPGPVSHEMNSPTRWLFRKLGGVGLPTTVFIDRKGVIRAIHVGQLTPAILANRLHALGVRRNDPITHASAKWQLRRKPHIRVDRIAANTVGSAVSIPFRERTLWP